MRYGEFLKIVETGRRKEKYHLKSDDTFSYVYTKNRPSDGEFGASSWETRYAMAAYVFNRRTNKLCKDVDGLFANITCERDIDVAIRPKKALLEVDTLNIWYSPNVRIWNVCALIILPMSEMDLESTSEGIRKRTKTTHDSFAEALRYIEDNYVGGTFL